VAHILLIEDDDEVVEFTRTLLSRSSDFTLDVAGDGERALVAYMTRRPDVILLDVFVPRLDGVRFAREIASRFPADRPAIVVWTGAADAESMADLVETPYVLPKPVSSVELLETLRRALHLPSRVGSTRVLAAGERLSDVRALVRELRSDFDVQAAQHLDDLPALIERLKPRALVAAVVSDAGVQALRQLAAPRLLQRFAVIAGDAPLAVPLAEGGIRVARTGELVASIRSALR
jgi:CheY-like chemotaxis protein